MPDEKKAALVDGFENYIHDYRNSALPQRKGAALNAVDEIIAGQSEADRFIRAVAAESAMPDALFERLREFSSSQMWLRGFCRALQKQIERCAR